MPSDSRAFVGAAAGTVAGGVDAFVAMSCLSCCLNLRSGRHRRRRGRDAEGAFEDALQVKRLRRPCHPRRQLSGSRVGFNQLADTRDHCGVRGSFARMTARRRGIRSAQRRRRWGRRLLIRAVGGGQEGGSKYRGTHRKDELSVGIYVALWTVCQRWSSSSTVFICRHDTLEFKRRLSASCGQS